MLRVLRKRLTLLCVIITGVLLTAAACALLFLSESQMDRQSEVTFQNNINSLIYKLQSSHIIDRTWLSQLEAGNGLIVHIEDSGAPLLFQGSWTPPTDRAVLIHAVQKKALEDHNLDAKARPYSTIDIPSVTFPIKGNEGDTYQAAVVILPASGSSWQSITLLRDNSVDEQQKLVLRLSAISIVVVTLLLLFLFSWWFAGRSIAPIEESRKKQVEFIAAASHELRSPLAVIQASLSAAQGIECTERRKHFTDTAVRESSRMAGLIDDLLFLASSDAKTWSVQQERIEPDTLMLELYDSFEPLMRSKSQTLQLLLPDEALPVLWGDQKRLFQCLSVLLDNALAYTPEGGQITLLAEIKKHQLQLSVADSGPGVSDAQKGHIFDRFYRGDPSRNKKDHYGLGLAVALEIAELHGGSIQASDTPGGGATFTLCLPLQLLH